VKKTRQPNWEHVEVLTLAKAKGDEHIANFDIVNRWDKFETMVTKWNKISAQVMNARCSTHLRNGVACKDKWGLITKEFKNIFHYKQELDITKITSLWILGTKLLWDCQWILDRASMTWLYNFLAQGPYSTHLVCGTLWKYANCIYIKKFSLTPIDAINLNNDSKDATK